MKSIPDSTSEPASAIDPEMLGAIEFLRTLPKHELEAAYRRAKADETDKGQRAACLIGREIIQRVVERNGP